MNVAQTLTLFLCRRNCYIIKSFQIHDRWQYTRSQLHELMVHEMVLFRAEHFNSHSTNYIFCYCRCDFTCGFALVEAVNTPRQCKTACIIPSNQSWQICDIPWYFSGIILPSSALVLWKDCSMSDIIRPKKASLTSELSDVI